MWVQPKGYKVVGAVLAASRDANLGNAEVERASRGHYNISRRFFLRKEGRMFLRKKKSTERLPWYRAHKGDLTESEKRQLDSFRMRKDHPAASYDNLPKEVRMYMSKLELQLYDKTQEGLARGCFVVSGIGAFLFARYFFGYAESSLLEYTGSISLLVVPWIYYSIRWKRNADEFLPPGDFGSRTAEALRMEWELKYIADKRSAERQRR